MKKLILTLIFILTFNTMIIAADDYPWYGVSHPEEMVTFDNIQYKHVIVNESWCILFRVDAWPVETPATYLDGSAISRSYPSPWKASTQPERFEERVDSIFKAIFSISERLDAQGDKLYLTFYFDNTEGQLIGVWVEFSLNANKLSRLPLSKFALFEQKLIEAGFRFGLSDEARKRTYNMSDLTLQIE